MDPFSLMNRSLLTLLAIVILAGIAITVAVQPESGRLDADSSTHFSISDTSQVTKIRIADSRGQSAVLERSDHPLGLWTLNGRLLARKDATDLLLKTFKRISVRQPVQSTAVEGVLKMMASSGKRVDIHLNGENAPTKTWFIGTPTQSHTGTHMLLEWPGKGRSSEPYVTHMEGFTGFLSTRFFTSEGEWRYTGVYESSATQIESIAAWPLDDPGKHARLSWSKNQETLEAEGEQGPLNLPQPLLREQWLRLCKVHIETWDSHLTPAAQDSLKRSAPAWHLEVAYRDGRNIPMDLYWKNPIMEELDLQGNIMTHDGSRMYAVVNGEVALVQTFVFNPILDFWRDLETQTNASAS